MRDEIGESCSLGVSEEDEVYYIARAETSRIMSVNLRPGSRLPLYATSMGRVLLAARLRAEQERYLQAEPLVERTSRTVTDPSSLMDILRDVAEQDFAIVDQELELGIRSVAVPVRHRGEIVAAINVGTQAGRMTLADLRTRLVPALRRAATDLGSVGLSGQYVFRTRAPGRWYLAGLRHERRSQT